MVEPFLAPLSLRPAHLDSERPTLPHDQKQERQIPHFRSRLSLHRDLATFLVAFHLLEALAPFPTTTQSRKTKTGIFLPPKSPSPSLSLHLLNVCVSSSVYLSVCLYQPLSVSLCLSVSQSLCHSLPLALNLSLSLCLSISLSVSICLSLSLSLSISLSLSLFLSQTFPLFSDFKATP